MVRIQDRAGPCSSGDMRLHPRRGVVGSRLSGAAAGCRLTKGASARNATLVSDQILQVVLATALRFSCACPLGHVYERGWWANCFHCKSASAAPNGSVAWKCCPAVSGVEAAGASTVASALLCPNGAQHFVCRVSGTRPRHRQRSGCRKKRPRAQYRVESTLWEGRFPLCFLPHSPTAGWSDAGHATSITVRASVVTQKRAKPKPKPKKTKKNKTNKQTIHTYKQTQICQSC